MKRKEKNEKYGAIVKNKNDTLSTDYLSLILKRGFYV